MNNIRLAVSIALLGACNLAFGIAQATEAGQYAFLSTEDDLYDFYGGADFVSIATGSKQPIHKAPAVASVITAEQIRRMAAFNLDDILTTIPGLHVSRISNRNAPIYVFRGVHTRFNPQVLMLINGIPVTNLLAGNRGQIWGDMPVEAISRIEIIRGPGSALYGADAFVGVINIITLGSTDTTKQTGARIGSFGTRNLWFSWGQQFNQVRSALHYEFYQTDGHGQLIEADAQSFLDSVFNTTASITPAPMDNFRHNHEWRGELAYRDLTFRAGLQKRQAGAGAGLVEALAPRNVGVSNRWNVDLTYDNSQFGPSSELFLQASHFATSQEYKNELILFPPGADIGMGAPFPDGVIGMPEAFEKHQRLQAIYAWSGLTQHSLRFGAGYNNHDLYKVREFKNFGRGPNGEFLPPGSPLVDVSNTPFVYMPQVHRESHYAFVQDIWQIANDWELTTGLRYDNYSDFGSTTNPRIALTWLSSIHLTTKLLHGRAFRAPSFAETHAINNPAALGNPEILPENMRTTELQFDYHPQNGINWIISLFNYTWSDIIQFVPSPSGIGATAQNTGKHSGHGLEAELSWSPAQNLMLRANYSWQRSTNDRTGERIPMVPGWQAFLQADYQLNDAWQLNVHLNHVADRIRASNDPRDAIADYSLVNASLRWNKPGSAISLALIGKNLLNSDAREPTANNGPVVNIPYDIPLAGRAVVAELRVNF